MSKCEEERSDSGVAVWAGKYVAVLHIIVSDACMNLVLDDVEPQPGSRAKWRQYKFVVNYLQQLLYEVRHW